MKTKFLIFFLLAFSKLFAIDYFVRVDGGAGAGTSDASAWNVAKVNTMWNTLFAGDRLLFRAGQTFATNIVITTNAGTLANPITYGSYGVGAKPIVTGLASLTSWTAHPTITGVWYASLDVERLQIVLVNGVLKEMGRYPKSGYNSISSHTGLSTYLDTLGISITAPTIGSLPDPTGGTVVIKHARYIINQYTVYSSGARSGTGNNTLNFIADNKYGANRNYPIDNGNGYFIENCIGTLTAFGDWYYDNAANRLYVYFGASAPSNNTVQVSMYQDLISANSKTNIAIDNLDLIGANRDMVNCQYSNHISITNCNMKYGSVGIEGLQGSGVIDVYGNTISDMYSGGVNTYENPYTTFINNYIYNIGLKAGMMYSGDLVASGMSLTGNYMIVRGNRVENVGYCGIGFYGSEKNDYGKAGNHVLVENNFVNGFNTTKDDGGGIYTYGNYDSFFVDRIIRKNIVLNGIGNIEGALGVVTIPTAMGIYLDDHTSDISVYDNYVAHTTGAGIFLNSTQRDTVHHNTFFDNALTGLLLLHLSPDSLYKLNFHDNTFIAKGNNPLVSMEMYVDTAKVRNLGVFINNHFYAPFGSSSFMRIDDRRNNGQIITNRTLAQWQAYYGYESGSSVSTVPITSVADFHEETNFTSSDINVPSFTVKKDVLGNSYSNGLPVSAYSGNTFIETGVPVVAPPTNVLKIYRRIKIL